jgi:hypothetical protein
MRQKSFHFITHAILISKNGFAIIGVKKFDLTGVSPDAKRMPSGCFLYGYMAAVSLRDIL